ncbi:MAG: polyprenol phosphomannose-dependent alpha 1,6 mannosyltransferase MptB [Acidimicrobiales bacterium]
MSTAAPPLSARLRARLQGLSMAADGLRLRLAPSLALSEREPGGGSDDWSCLRRPALLGFIAVLSIGLGASLPSSPFKLEMPGTWFFGEGDGTSTVLLLPGLVAVYGGMLLFIRVWYGLVKTLRHRPGAPVRALVGMLALWTVPLLMVAPLFSRDVFSYAAQGEMMSHHINPYQYGPATIGSGQFVNPVDGLWLNTPAPYGPLFLMVDGWFAAASGHNAVVTVLFLRLLSVVGVGLIAYCIPKLARAHGRDPGSAFVLAVLNPLTLLALIGGMHNDAIMVGLLVAGITAAKTRHPVWGIVLCTLAAAIKVPAAMGIIYVAWEWAGPETSWRERVRPLVKAALVALAVMVALTLVSGLGWGWIANLGTPGTVRSWMAPATAIGLVLSGALHVMGVGVGLGGVLTVTRALGLLGAVVIAVYCLVNERRLGMLRALGITMLMFVLLGPVVQPWYLTWAIILMAPVVEGRLRTLVLGISMVAPFIGLTGGASLLDQLVRANPASMVVAVAVLWAIVMVPLGSWTTSWQTIDTSTSHRAPPLPTGSAFEA